MYNEVEMILLPFDLQWRHDKRKTLLKNTTALTAGDISEVHQQYLYQKVWFDLETVAMNSVSVLSYHSNEIGEKKQQQTLLKNRI